MSDADVTEIATQTMLVGAKVAAPILLTALLVGFMISLFQAATQIQEPTLSFVPKMIAVAIALLVTGNWVLSTLVSLHPAAVRLAAAVARPGLSPGGPAGPGGDAGGAAARDGPGHRVRRAGPAVQLAGDPGAGQGRARPGPVPAAVPHIAPRCRRSPRASCRHRGHRGDHRRGAGLPRPGAVHRRPAGRRPHRRHRRVLAAAGLRPDGAVQHAVIGKLHYLLATTLLFTSGGHLLLVRGFVTSYEGLPLGGSAHRPARRRCCSPRSR